MNLNTNLSYCAVGKINEAMCSERRGRQAERESEVWQYRPIIFILLQHNVV